MKGIGTIKFTRLPYRVQNNIRDEMTTFFELYLVPDRPFDNFSIEEVYATSIYNKIMRYMRNKGLI